MSPRRKRDVWRKAASLRGAHEGQGRTQRRVACTRTERADEAVNAQTRLTYRCTTLTLDALFWALGVLALYAATLLSDVAAIDDALL